jgi:ABC-type glycerol-3-phosphate transport system substrate-binding protein
MTDPQEIEGEGNMRQSVHRSRRRRGDGVRRTVVAAVVAVAAIVAVGCGGSSSSTSTSSGSSTTGGAPKPATIDLWLSGQFGGATPGSTYRKWVDAQVDRFKQDHPGSDVKVTLLAFDNDQTAAKLQAAFTSKQVPDVALIFSGGYTTPYIASLSQLNQDVDANPGMYDSISAWDLSCAKLDCAGGKGQIYGVPLEFVTYGIFYNKALFAKANIAAPPKTWDELLSACSKLKAAGVIPIAYGDRDGYSTDNWVTLMYASTMAPGDIQKVDDGSLPYTDPKLVQPLTTLTSLRKNGCVNPDASTRENSDANSDFTSGKAAMVLMYPQVTTDFQKALGDKLGIFAIPVSGTGPLAGKVAGNSNDNFVIPKDAKNKQLAFDFIKTATDETAGQQLLKIVGSPTTNKAAAATPTDPIVGFFLDGAKDPAMPLLDSVIPAKIALFYYKELQQAFSGKASPEAAMQAVQDDAAQASP